MRACRGVPPAAFPPIGTAHETPPTTFRGNHEISWRENRGLPIESPTKKANLLIFIDLNFCLRVLEAFPPETNPYCDRYTFRRSDCLEQGHRLIFYVKEPGDQGDIEQSKVRQKCTKKTTKCTFRTFWKKSAKCALCSLLVHFYFCAISPDPILIVAKCKVVYTFLM